MAEEAVGISSDVWQRAARPDEASAYLQRLAAMPIVRDIAVRSLALMAVRPGERVLDVGCGTGLFLPLLGEAVGQAGRVTGVDQGLGFVEEARERVSSLGNTTVDVGDAYDLPYPDDSFDVAHCERVLMHLDEPTAALREMQRVVRPGGRMVAAEPAWATVTIDHPDHEAIELLMRERNKRVRNPRIGLELNRRMADAGLVERCIEAVAIASRDLAEFEAYGLHLRAAADALADSGQLPRARSQRILADLQLASDAGTFFGAGLFLLGFGRVPVEP